MIRKHLRLRIPATKLESFRLYLTKEWMTHEKFMLELKGEEPASPAMALGIAYDKIMERPAKYLLVTDGGAEFYECNGFRFDADSMDNALDYTERRAICQYKAVREYEVNGTCVELVCKADALYGIVAWDYKARMKALDADKSIDYTKSLQWKAYTEVFGLRKFIYLVSHISENGGVHFVEETVPIELYPYDGLSGEVFNYLSDFVQFIENQRLETYFQPKKKAVAV